MHKSCFIEGCTLYKRKDTSFHRFPHNEDFRNEWCESIRVMNNQPNAYTYHSNSHVCGHHFHPHEKYISGKKTLLHKNVIPTIYPKSSQNESMGVVMESFTSPDDDLSDSDSVIMLGQHDPLDEENVFVEQSSYVFSDSEDFFGFEEGDVSNEIVNASTGEVYVVFARDGSKNDADNDTNHENRLENPLEEAEDEIIFVENNVEVIEIEDEDDNEVQTSPIKVQMPPGKVQPRAIKPISSNTKAQKGKVYSRYIIQQMVVSNHPDIELRKTTLDWKSDQFRMIYINGENQNVCTCTKCWELFDEINVDSIVRHARCNPVPRVALCAKWNKFNDPAESPTAEEASQATVQNLTISKIMALATCMDVRTLTFYQGQRFFEFAQYLIDTGASVAASTSNKTKFAYEPKQNVLCSFRDQLKDNQLAKILSILNTPDSDYSLSCDVWEDYCRRITNIALELHYLDTNFRRHRIVIGVRSINALTVKDLDICDRILDILRTYSKNNNGTEFLQKATALVTSRKLDTVTLGAVSFPSACSVIDGIANEIVNEHKLKIAEKCLDIIEWLNQISMEKITMFDARQWQNIYGLFQRFISKKNLFIEQAVECNFPKDDFIVPLLEPFHQAILKLSEPTNNITKVFGIFKLLGNGLKPLGSDKELVKSAKTKALETLQAALAESDAYQISMFLDLSNREQYSALRSDEIDSLQSKIDSMINPYVSTVENGCVENDLVHFMDDNVTSQKNQVDQFLQLSMPSNDDPYEFWRDNDQMPGLKALARKYFTIPTYASLSECARSEDVRDYLVKRSNLEIKDLETMLMMNSCQSDNGHSDGN